jgi:hypothetical protein
MSACLHSSQEPPLHVHVHVHAHVHVHVHAHAQEPFSSPFNAPCSRFLRVQNSVSAAAPQPGEVRPGGGGGCEDVMAEVDPTTVTTHVRAYWAKKKKVLDEIVLKDTLGAPLCRPLCVRSALHLRSEAHPNPHPPNRYRHLRTRAPL